MFDLGKGKDGVYRYWCRHDWGRHLKKEQRFREEEEKWDLGFAMGS